jgi:hypothetical protein
MDTLAQWRPATPLEESLWQAVSMGDRDGYFANLATASLRILVRQLDASNPDSPDFRTQSDSGRISLVGFTSFAAMTMNQPPQPHVVLDLPQLAAAWPDPTWGLLVNPGHPLASRLPGWFVRQLVDQPSTGLSYGRDEGFKPANLTEHALLDAAGEDDPGLFLKVVVGAAVLVPVDERTPPDAAPGDHDFGWRIDDRGGRRSVLVFTSEDRLRDHFRTGVACVRTTVSDLLQHWPDPSLALAVNPGSAVGAILPADRVHALAAWAGQPPGLAERRPVAPTLALPASMPRPAIMQKAVAYNQVALYVEDGHDRIGGLVHGAEDVAFLTPDELCELPGSPPEWVRSPEDGSIHVIRWPGFCPGLYRQVVNSDPRAYVACGVLLPHRATLVRLWPDGYESLVGEFDAPSRRWSPEQAPTTDPYRGDLCDGYFASLRGREHLAWPSADGVFLDAYSAGDTTASTWPIPMDANGVEDLRYRRTTCEWRGAAFVIIGESREWLRVELDSARLSATTALEPFDHLVRQAWVARDEVRNRRDELVRTAAPYP